MPNYHVNTELEAYTVSEANYTAVRDSWSAAAAQQQADYQAQHDAWETTVGQRSDEYQAQHDRWQADHDAWVAQPTDPLTGDPIPEPPEPAAPEMPPEPVAPVPAPEPQPPAKPGVYASRELAEPELIATATGEALVVPPRVVLTGPDGTEAALSRDELEAGYTLAATARL